MSIRYCFPAISARGMVAPSQLFDYLGLKKEEIPDKPNVVTLPLSALDKNVQYLTKKGGNLIPFKPAWGVNAEGLSNPGFGAYQHYAQVTVDELGMIGTVDYDFIRIADGALDAAGNGTSGVE
jgi:hypothetical protein